MTKLFRVGILSAIAVGLLSISANAAPSPDPLAWRTEADWQQAFDQLRRTDGDFRVESLAEFKRITNYYREQVSEGNGRNAFHTRDGNFIRCIDIASQTSFLESARPGSEPPLAPRVLPREPEANADLKPTADADLGKTFGLDGSRDEDGNVRLCPALTFPKLISPLTNLYHFRNLEEMFQKSPEGYEGPPPRTITPYATPPTNHEYAHAYSAVNNIGCRASFNLWSPFVEQNDEFSLSQLWTVGGNYADSTLQSVEMGWQVYRNLYGDSKAHLFIYSTSAAYAAGSGCYNVTCSRFVQTDSSVVLGSAFSSYSSLGGTQYEIQLESFREPGTAKWWIKFGSTWLGYYPQSLFNSSGLLNSAVSIDFGGEIVNDSTGGVHTSTDMGSGHFPSEGFGQAAYISNITYFDVNNNAYYAGGLQRYVTNASYYDLDLFTNDPTWHTYFYFGGPGGTGGSGGLPNLAPYQPAGWIDKIVVATAPGSTIYSATDATVIHPTDTIYLNWAIVNDGSAATASAFYSAVYVDGVLWNGNAYFHYGPSLTPNGYVAWTDALFGSLTSGVHTIKIVADSTNVIPESNESDNSYTKTITVTGPASGCDGTSRGSCIQPVARPGVTRVSGGR